MECVSMDNFGRLFLQALTIDSMKMKWAILVSVTITAMLILFVGAVGWLMRPFNDKSFSNISLDSKMLIAHAGGLIDGYSYTNSKEALLKSISEGYLYIELDLYGTTDDSIVCLHELEDFHDMTNLKYMHKFDSGTFKNIRLHNKYTPLTLNEAIEIWEAHPFTFVTDKISDPTILNHYFTHNKNHVMVEAKNAIHYKKLKNDGFITMLSLDRNINGLIKFVFSSILTGTIIDRIVIPKATDICYLRFYKRLGVKVAMYTINDSLYFNKHFAGYVNYIYTDSISPKNLHK